MRGPSVARPEDRARYTDKCFAGMWTALEACSHHTRHGRRWCVPHARPHARPTRSSQERQAFSSACAAMAKSLRSKVKKRLRTVKRGVIKKELATAGSKLNVREVAKEVKNAEALSGHLQPGKRLRSAFRYDDNDAVFPQHNFRQGPDFRSGWIGAEAGYALVGARRPKHPNGLDAPTAFVPPKTRDHEMMEDGTADLPATDGGVRALLRGSHQVVPLFASKKLKRKLKQQAKDEGFGSSATAKKNVHKWV